MSFHCDAIRFHLVIMDSGDIDVLYMYSIHFSVITLYIHVFKILNCIFLGFILCLLGVKIGGFTGGGLHHEMHRALCHVS